MSLNSNNSNQSVGFKNSCKALCLAAVLVSGALTLGHAATAAIKPKPPAVVTVKRLTNGHFQLLVDKKPYIIKGVCYSPIPVGENHEYDWWTDPSKPWLVDGSLMQKMGINTIRIYHPGTNPEAVKQVIRDFYEKFGIRTILGHWLGYWEFPCPFYGDKNFQEKITAEVSEMVKEYKDEPGVLFWILGNENNYSCLGRVNPWTNPEIDQEPDPQKKNILRARIYYSFLNDLSKKIHQIDRNHPVALGNGELLGLEHANTYAQDVDIVACIIYRGKTFGNLFKSIRSTFDRPVMLAEFGADAFDAYLKKEDQSMQAFFLESQWRQIYANLAQAPDGEGNCLGGTMFEWSDEWWKHNEFSPATWWDHDTESNWSNGSYYFDIKAEGNKNMNEEWFGIVGLSERPKKSQGLDKRTPRKAYYVIRDFWKNPQAPVAGKKR